MVGPFSVSYKSCNLHQRVVLVLTVGWSINPLTCPTLAFVNVYSVFVKSYNKNMESMCITPIFTSLFTDLGLVWRFLLGGLGLCCWREWCIFYLFYNKNWCFSLLLCSFIWHLVWIGFCRWCSNALSSVFNKLVHDFVFICLCFVNSGP